MVDPIDEYAIQHVTEFDGKKLQSVTKEGLKFGDEDEALEAKRTKLYKETFKPLTDYFKELYGDAVVKVSISKRVETTPTIIVTSQYGNSANMERITRGRERQGSRHRALRDGDARGADSPSTPPRISAGRLFKLVRKNMGVPDDAAVEEDDDVEEDEAPEEEATEEEAPKDEL